MELEPADVVSALAAGNEIAFQVVGDGAGFGVDGEGAEIGRITVKGGSLFIGCCVEHSFCIGRKRLAIRFEVDVDAHMARRVVQDEAGGTVIEVRAARRIPLNGDQAPGADKLF